MSRISKSENNKEENLGDNFLQEVAENGNAGMGPLGDGTD